MAVKIEKKIVGYSVVSKDTLEADQAAAAQAAAQPDEVQVDYDPSSEALDGAPMGMYDAKRYGAEYHHPLKGRQALFVSASYFPAKGLLNGQDVAAARWFEAFMPAGQREDIQPWVSVTMKMMTLLLQQGVPLSRILRRFDSPGSDNILFELPSGKKKFFSSEVQVVGQAFKNLAYNQGLLDEEGNDIPFFKRAVAVGAQSPFIAEQSVGAAAVAKVETASSEEVGEYPPHARTCAKCGVKAVVKMDGCDTCLSCSDSKCG
jgi:hypothetical protein